jgi:hypothetical protein
MNDRSVLAWSRVAANVGVLLAPFVVAIVGGCYTNAVRDAEIRARYVEVAVAILRENPSDKAGDKTQTPKIREWAMDVINQLSPIPLSQEARSELRARPLPVAEWARRHNVGATMTPPAERR